MKVFDFPINYTKRENSASDNNFNTAEEPGTLVFNIEDNNEAATKVTHIFTKSIGMGSYNVPSGMTTITRIVPDMIENSVGEMISADIAGFRHDLYELPSPITEESLSLGFSTGKLYEVMLLNELVEFDEIFNEITFGFTNSPIQKSIGGQFSKVPFVNGNRSKRRNTYSGIYRVSIKDQFDTFLELLKNKDHITFCDEFTRFPDSVFTALFPESNKQFIYLNNVKGDGYRMNFTVWEM